MTYILQAPKLLEEFNCQTNVDILIGDYDKEQLDSYLQRLKFKEVFNSKKNVSKLSGGELRKLNIIVNLLKDSDIYLIDEIENDLDPSVVGVVYELITELNGIVIICSHSVDNNSLPFNGILNFNQHTIELESLHEFVKLSSTVNQEIKNSLTSSDILTLSKTNFYNNFLFVIIITAILAILLFMSITISITSKSLQRPAENFSDNVMVISPPINSSLYAMYGNDDYTKDIKFNFTKKDYQFISSLDGIKEIYPIAKLTGEVNNSNIQIGDEVYDFTKEVDLSGIDYKQYGFEEYTLLSNQYTIGSGNLIYPKEVFDTTPLILTFIDGMFVGEYPNDSTNEVMIDIYTALYLVDLYNLSSIDDLVGRDVTVLGQGHNDTIDYTFKISGVFKTDPELRGNDSFYYSYHPENSIVMRNNCSLFDPTTIDYRECVAIDANLNINAPINEEQMAQIGDISAIYIVANDDTSEKAIYHDIKEYDPYIDIDGNYARTKFTSFVYIKNRVIFMIIAYLVIFGAMVLLIRLIRKLVVIELEKIRSTLVHFGFGQNQIIKLMQHEASVLTKIIVVLIFSFLLFALLTVGLDFIMIITFVISAIAIIFILKWIFKKEING